MSEFSSTILYIFVWGLTTILAFLAEQKERTLEKLDVKRKNGYFITLCIIIGLTYVLADISADYKNYTQIYEYLTWKNFLQVTSVEPLYAIICLVIKVFIRSADIGLVIIKLCTLIFYMKSIYNIRHKIHLGYAILTYMSLIYLDSFCMIAMHLAVSICAYSYSIYIKNAKISLPVIVWGIVAVFIHYTCLLYIIILAFTVVIYFRKKMNSTFWIAFSVISSLVVYLYFDVFWSFLATYIPAFNKYQIYQSVENDGTGLMQFIYHIPLIILLVYGIRYRQDRKMGLSILFFELVGFVIALLGYRIEVINRLYILCSLPILFGVTQFFKRGAIRFKGYQTRMIISILLVVYFVFRFADNVRSTLTSLGIAEYHMLFMN